jgi:hypothetical protein
MFWTPMHAQEEYSNSAIDMTVPTNGSVHIMGIILKHVMASVTEAELAKHFYNAHDTCSLYATLEQHCHPQPLKAIQTYN